jgi:hypothetical protein
VRAGQSIGRVVQDRVTVDPLVTPGNRYSPGLRMTVPVRRYDRDGTEWRIATAGNVPGRFSGSLYDPGDPRGVPSDYESYQDYLKDSKYYRAHK